MINITDLHLSNELKHLFIPANKANEVLWLLKNAGADMSKIRIEQWRRVVNNQVQEIEHISEADRNVEIEKLYGEYAKYVEATPVVILTYYDISELFGALRDSLLGDGDPDYIAYFDRKQEEIRGEEISES